MTACRRCKAPIMWVKSPAGKPMPLDPEPTRRGNVRVDRGVGTVLAGAELEIFRAASAWLYLSHFATCPYADEFRKAAAA